MLLALRNWQQITGRKVLAIALLIVLVFIYSFYTFSNILQVDIKVPESYSQGEKYLIYTPKCRIPDENPFNEDVLKFFHPMQHKKCSNYDGLLTYIEKDSDIFTLKINTTLLSSYSYTKINCCYRTIKRIMKINESDDDLLVSKCEHFSESANVTAYNLIKVECENVLGVNIYSNVHAIFNTNILNKSKLEQFEANNISSKFSVLFVGIDSMSKMNLKRTMPTTVSFMEQHDFINIKGYTKVGDNTFPNLVALLIGREWTQVYEYCHPDLRNMNGCDLIWDRFRDAGYVTAYGEDETPINTFHYYRKGFAEPPTDYYFRPYFLATEKLLKHDYYCDMRYCTGPEAAGERILNLAKDFKVSLNNYPQFGFFWTTSFSHDNINCPSALDKQFAKFMSDIHPYLNNTIFIFFSDHGFRFGDIRYTHTGWLEERLPFIYVLLPNNFKQLHPDKYKAFVTNSQRLTTPYDLYMTLQDLVAMANDSYHPTPSVGCPKCQSMFTEITPERTCSDAEIAQHWCVCKGHSYINTATPIVMEITKFVINEINSLISNYSDGHKCASYSLNKITSAGMSESYLNANNESVNYFLLMFETFPRAMFEATVEASSFATAISAANIKRHFHLLGEISRLSRYADNSKCVEGSTLKKYCYCDGILNKFKSAICSVFNCN